MTADHLLGIDRFEADLWKVADNLRANSNLASNEYFMPVLGLIFLRQATNRYHAACDEIAKDVAAGRMPDRPLVEADFTRRRALMLPEKARYDALLAKRKDGSLGSAVTGAMDAVENPVPSAGGPVAEGLRTLRGRCSGRDDGDVQLRRPAPRRRAMSSGASTSTFWCSSRRRRHTTTASSSRRRPSFRPS